MVTAMNHGVINPHLSNPKSNTMKNFKLLQYVLKISASKSVRRSKPNVVVCNVK